MIDPIQQHLLEEVAQLHEVLTSVHPYSHPEHISH